MERWVSTRIKGGLIWYIDGSKTNKGTGAGMYGHGTWQKLSFSLGQYTTVFQVEAYAIKACTVENLDRTIETETSMFYQIVKQQLKHLANTRSLQNWFGTATNPSYIRPNIIEFS
jgi:hypothetical protein